MQDNYLRAHINLQAFTPNLTMDVHTTSIAAAAGTNFPGIPIHL